MKDYYFINSKMKSLLRDSRYKHCLNVEDEALKLGRIYNSDLEKCRIAAIAHDCTKEFSDDELINKAKEYKLKIDEIQYNSPQLLHGPVGAEYIRHEFNILDDDIYNAVCFHTTGRKNMSLLEKIIYIADMTEEGREYPLVDEIRALSVKNLDEALYLSCNSTISYVIKRDLVIHPLTIDLRNSLLLGRSNNGK